MSSAKTILKICFLTGILFGSQASCLADNEIKLKQSDQSLTLLRGETPILVYHTADVPPPEGVDPVYRRSGFIYPLHAPSGGVVTGIHPDDHYHHLGLWHAWVKTEYGDHKPDFWNLGKKKTGRVRYVKTRETRDTGFTVEQQQVAYLNGADAEPTVILKEVLTIDVAFVDGANVIDYTLTQTNVAEKEIVFPAYRYGGGIAFRAPHSWDKANSDYLTSKGLTRTNSHGTRARWVAMFGPAENGGGKQASVQILCHPDNRDAPQRIRTWGLDAAGGSGSVFFNYVPVQENGWSIAPGKSVTLRYRIIVHDGKPTVKTYESHWKKYTG